MADWYIVSALVVLDEPNSTQQVLRIPTHDSEIRNHYHNLEAQGIRVISIKVIPWHEDAADVEYEQDETPTLTEVLSDPLHDVGIGTYEENTDTNETTGSSD
jgi:hypothetical protein